MADVYTTTGAVDYSQVAYDRLAYFAYRPELYFDAAAEVQPTNQAMPGSSVVFTIQNDLAVAATPLSEVIDVSAVALSDSQVTVTLLEYGNAAITTAKLRGTAFIDVDTIVANVVGFNAGVSIDTVARNVLQAGANVSYALGTGSAQTSRGNVAATNTFGSHDIRLANAALRRNNVPTFGGLYAGFINPDVSVDLREETGAAGWRQPHDYSAPDNIWAGEIGAYEGVRFVESPRAPIFANAGAGGAVAVYRTIFMGRQGLAKAWSIEDGNGAYPRVVQGPVVDKLRRFVPMGWYWLGGYGRFREAAIYAVESSASIAPAGGGTDALPVDQ